MTVLWRWYDSGILTSGGSGDLDSLGLIWKSSSSESGTVNTSWAGSVSSGLTHGGDGTAPHNPLSVIYTHRNIVNTET